MENNQLTFLKSEIAARLSQVESSMGWFRRRHYYIKASVVVLSALITMFSGIEFAWLTPESQKAIVLVLGALISVLATFGAFFSPKDTWLLNAESSAKLRRLGFRIQFAEKGEGSAKIDSAFLEEARSEYQAIFDEYNAKWQDLRKNEKSG